MFGYCNEICGEQGYAWSKRLMMVHSMLTNPNVDGGTKAFWTGFGKKYGYSPEAAEAAPERMATIIRSLASRLERHSLTLSRKNSARWPPLFAAFTRIPTRPLRPPSRLRSWISAILFIRNIWNSPSYSEAAVHGAVRADTPVSFGAAYDSYTSQHSTD